jgi:hypothetical protein
MTVRYAISDVIVAATNQKELGSSHGALPGANHSRAREVGIAGRIPREGGGMVEKKLLQTRQ